MPPMVVCLWGNLGSGKTTFVQGFARGLGIRKRVLSPTFIIVRRYETGYANLMLCHWDLYRAENMRDVDALGFEEMVADSNITNVIEWPERLEALLPKHRLDIRFSVLPDERHEIHGELT